METRTESNCCVKKRVTPFQNGHSLAYPLNAREPLAKRIVHTDPTKYSREAHVHEGAGEMQFEELFDTSAFDTNLLFLHRGVLPPKAGIGHHYHNQMEEMFVILDN